MESHVPSNRNGGKIHEAGEHEADTAAAAKVLTVARVMTRLDTYQRWWADSAEAMQVCNQPWALLVVNVDDEDNEQASGSEADRVHT